MSATEEYISQAPTTKEDFQTPQHPNTHSIQENPLFHLIKLKPQSEQSPH